MCAKLLYRCQNRPRLAPGYCRPFSVGIPVLLPPSDLCSAFSSTRIFLPMYLGVLSSASLMWLLLPTLSNLSLIHILLINLNYSLFILLDKLLIQRDIKFLIADINVFDYHTEYCYNEICTTGMNKNDFK